MELVIAATATRNILFSLQELSVAGSNTHKALGKMFAQLG